ncbi:hypothetical protein OF83DRAFT_119627 [Amylostereum chailletii]|nr:hypothetical protein OF83DRAFT_119627 [Amylostereum chailletii]
MDPSIAPSSAPPIAPQQHDDLNVQIYEVKDPGENRFDQPMRSRVLGLLPEENASSLGGRKRVESDTRADAGVVKRHKRWIERSGAARVKLAGLTRLHNASQDPQPTPQPAPLSASQAVPVPVPAPASPSASSITATDASAPAPLPPKPSAVAMYCAYMQQFRPRRMLFLLPEYRESVLFMKRIRRKSVDSTVQTSTTLSDHVEFFEKWVNLRLRTFLTATNHPEKTLRNFFSLSSCFIGSLLCTCVPSSPPSVRSPPCCPGHTLWHLFGRTSFLFRPRNSRSQMRQCPRTVD